jgi:signal transduction histidine kinase
MQAVARANHPGALRPDEVPVCAFLDEVAARAARHLDGRLTVDHPEERAVARLDVRWTERALLHMLHNAAVHGDHASPVELRARHTAGGWRFEVADRSGGVPAGAEEAVFMPFCRMASAPDRPGLGLAVVRSVAEAHGGSAGVANQPGVGATFWMRVPG